MTYREMLKRLDEADSLILSVFYKLKQTGHEKAASLELFDASIKIINAIEIIDKDVN